MRPDLTRAGRAAAEGRRAGSPGWRRAARRYWPAGRRRAAAALGWYAADSLRHRREGAFGYEIGTELEVGSRRFPACRRGAHRGADLDREPRPSCSINGDRIFPAFLETIRAAERTLNVQTYVYWRGEIADEVAAAIREKARGGRALQGDPRRARLGADGTRPDPRDARRRGQGPLFRPPKPYAIKRVANRTHRRVLVADGKVGMTGGVGIASEWMGDADGPDHWRDTHVRVRGPVVRGLQGAFAENWLEGTGEVLAGRRVPPGARAGGRRRADAGRALERQGRRHQRRGALLPRDRLGAASRSSSPPPTSFRARRSPRPSATPRARGRRPDAGPRPAHRQGRRPNRREGGLRRAARGGGAAVRVPADDAAREDALRRRHLVVGRHDQLRQPLVPAPRRGHAVGLGRALRRRARTGIRARPRALGRDRARPLAPARSAQRVGEAATTVLRREL